jgi:formamidopyrimidine-DNA glycosylase
MPEMPEVETLRRQIAPKLESERIDRVLHAVHPRFAPAHGAGGYHVAGTSRRGKYLIIGLSDPARPPLELILHLGMTGQLLWGSSQVTSDKHMHLGVETASGVLWFRDPRKFGSVHLVNPGHYDTLPTLASLGPEFDDPAFTPALVYSLLGPLGQSVKTRLLLQRALAGVGNYIADEALWRARIHPDRKSISHAEAKRLHSALRKVIIDSLALGGVSMRDYVHSDGSKGGYAAQLRAHGRGGLACYRCTSSLVKSVVGGRGSVWCPTCQPLT